MIKNELSTLESIPDGNWPRENKVQPGGSSVCRSRGEVGTLGVRVDRAPGNHFYYVATYHNFGENATDYTWEYFSNYVVEGQVGKVIERKYDFGEGRIGPTLDCALIQLTTASQSDIRRGAFKVTNKVRGVQKAEIGNRVVKYGMLTGYTYGRVVQRPAYFPPSYDAWLFFVKLTDSKGNPMQGSFSGAGDSGAPVFILSDATPGFVAGMVIQGAGDTSIISRIDQITASLQVSVHTDG